MQSTSANKALKIIEENPLVHVVWHKKSCIACQHFMPILENLSSLLPDWTFIKIDAEEHAKLVDNLYWEPTAFPISYLFKQGVRVFVAVGSAPTESIVVTHNEISQGTWKSPEQLEKEQLDALSE